MAEVTQADLDAAADFLETWEPGPEMTVVKLARVFARHRAAAFAAGALAMRERAAKECEAEAVSCRNEWNRKLGVEDTMADVADDCAAAIRALPIKEMNDEG